MIKGFQFGIPQRIYYEEQCIEKLPELVRQYAMGKVLIISDHGVERAGLLGRVCRVCEADAVDYSLFLEVEPNPSVATVENANEQYRQQGCFGIIAIGGGSSIDVAKAVSLLATAGGHVTDYEAGIPEGPTVPLIAIPTTAGSGSEVTSFAVITDHERDYKFSLNSPRLLPKCVLLDPTVLYGLPAPIAAATGMDAFIHAMEAYLSRVESPFVDMMAEKAMALIGGNLRAFVADRKNADAAGAMMLGSTFAGIAFTWGRLGDIHAMSHPVSAVYGVPHGVANAILLPAVLDFNKTADTGDRYRRIYAFLKGCGADVPEVFEKDMLIRLVYELLEEIGIPGCFGCEPHVMASQNPFSEEVCLKMAQDAMKSGNIAVNPRKTELQDVLSIYRKTFETPDCNDKNPKRTEADQ